MSTPATSQALPLSTELSASHVALSKPQLSQVVPKCDSGEKAQPHFQSISQIVGITGQVETKLHSTATTWYG